MLRQVMQNGKIAQAGTFEELLKQNIGFEVLVGAHSQALESVLTIESSSRTSEFAAVENETDADASSNQEFPHTKQDSEHNLSVEITEKEGRLVQDEEREKGSIGKEVYMAYLTTVKRGTLVPIILLAQSSFQVLQVLSNYWMAWACPAGDDQVVPGMDFILLVYTLLAVGSSLCVLLRASLVAISGLLTAEKLFSNMLNSVLRAPMAFFDSTPTGRILNRVTISNYTSTKKPKNFLIYSHVYIYINTGINRPECLGLGNGKQVRLVCILYHSATRDYSRDVTSCVGSICHLHSNNSYLHLVPGML